LPEGVAKGERMSRKLGMLIYGKVIVTVVGWLEFLLERVIVGLERVRGE
jgi:hypothetical protein